MSLRVTPELKAALEMAAQRSGRSQSQEAELRLELSIHNENLLPEILRLTYGRECAALLLVLAEAMLTAARRSANSWQWRLEGPDAWPSRPDLYAQAVEAASEIFHWFRPSGEPVLPDTETLKEYDVVPQAIRAIEDFRIRNPKIAANVVKQAIKEDRNHSWARVEAIRALLGEHLKRLSDPEFGLEHDGTNHIIFLMEMGRLTLEHPELSEVDIPRR